MDGIIIVDKPKGWTSRDVVNKISKVLRIKKVGHTGTLDPLATGVLVICTGKATKICELLTSTEKTYEAEAVLGIETDTLDLEGKIIKEENVHKKEEEIKKIIDSFPKKYMQEVPIYSAVKVDGRKLYEYARENEKVVLPKKEVEIKKIALKEILYEENKTKIKIECIVSKGTYIRSLVRDLAYSMNTVGTMTSLRRTKQGYFSLKDANTIEDIENNKYKLLTIEEVLPYKKIEVNDFLKNKIINGQKLENRLHEPILFTYEGKAIALYKEDNDKIKPWKMF